MPERVKEEHGLLEDDDPEGEEETEQVGLTEF